MLANNKLTISADTVIDGVKIANYGAVIDLETLETTLFNRHLDKEACKENRETVRSDQAEFEDFAYRIQDELKKEAE